MLNPDLNEVKEIVEKMLKMVGYNTSKVNFIPVSAWKGDNLVKKSENMSWYKGPTLAEALDCFIHPKNQLTNHCVYQFKMYILLLE